MNDYNLTTFKLTIDIFNGLSNKLIRDFEEAISNDITFNNYVKNLEKTYGIKINRPEFEKIFKEENEHLTKEQNQKRNSGILFAVIGAFVCELMLKYLIISNKEKFNFTHNLKKLYDRLPEKQKERIKKETMKNCHFISKEDFQNQLENSSENFKDLRYFFENKTHDLNFVFLKGFKTALMEELE